MFFSHLKYKKHNASNDNSFSAWLMQLQKLMDPAPRLVTTYKFYMAHKDYKTKVNNAFTHLSVTYTHM